MRDFLSNACLIIGYTFASFLIVAYPLFDVTLWLGLALIDSSGGFAFMAVVGLYMVAAATAISLLGWLAFKHLRGRAGKATLAVLAVGIVLGGFMGFASCFVAPEMACGTIDWF
jgi:hypothetical protein